MRVVLAITGASGVVYGLRTLEALKEAGAEVHLIVTRGAERVLEAEGYPWGDPAALMGIADARYGEDDLSAPPASGSWRFDSMAIVPCSMKTLAAIAAGLELNLVVRAAMVALKEGRRLVLVPRETPLARVHIANMLKAAEAGAVVLPACPGFYHAPAGIRDLVDHVVGKILDSLGVPHNLYRRWGAES